MLLFAHFPITDPRLNDRLQIKIFHWVFIDMLHIIYVQKINLNQNANLVSPHRLTFTYICVSNLSKFWQKVTDLTKKKSFFKLFDRLVVLRGLLPIISAREFSGKFLYFLFHFLNKNETFPWKKNRIYANCNTNTEIFVYL